MVYVIHLIILYGCAWFPGMIKFFGKSFSPGLTITMVITMYALMLGMILLLERYKKQKRQLIPKTQTSY